MKCQVLARLIVAVTLAAKCAPELAEAAETASSKRPNILFVVVDDLGKEWISCYGADEIKTPHIDEQIKGVRTHC